MLLRCLIRSRETMHLGKTHRFKKIASDAWHVGAGSAIIDGVCCGSSATKLGWPCHVRYSPDSD
jgi:hypothetical protein